MPEGDTIFRTAATLQKWVQARTVTGARTTVRGIGAERVVGTTIDEVTPKAKHLLIRFSNGLALHTHMGMTGSWHVYRAGERWKKPPWMAKFVLECDDRVAVCFNAPVVEMLAPSDERSHSSLNGLGPDVLGDLDLDEVRRRAGLQPPNTTMGELLLDQRVVSGIGNIYRCEALFLDRINPWTPVDAMTVEQFDHVVLTASNLMKANAGVVGDRGRAFDSGSERGAWVYGQTRRPCRRCGTPIKIARLGAKPRDVYWCPKCQPKNEAAPEEVPTADE